MLQSTEAEHEIASVVHNTLVDHSMVYLFNPVNPQDASKHYITSMKNCLIVYFYN